MIKIIACLLFISTSLFAEDNFDVTKKEFKSHIYMVTFSCVTPFGISHTQNRYKNGVLKLANLDKKYIEMDHTEATIKGCDFDKIDPIMEKALNHFGVLELDITVTKSKAKEPRMIRGVCKRLYKEKLEFDLGDGVILSTVNQLMQKKDDKC